MLTPDSLYEISIDPDCETVLRKLARSDRKLMARVDATIQALGDEPRPANCKQLKTPRNVLYRVPVGRSWRIIYAVIDDRLIILLLDVSSREGAYQNLDTLMNRLERFLSEQDVPGDF